MADRIDVTEIEIEDEEIEALRVFCAYTTGDRDLAALRAFCLRLLQQLGIEE